jgi:hypothetical protein
MGSLPKPLIGLLVGTVAFFALWMVALKPSSSSSSTGGSQGGIGQYQSAINKAHQAVTTSNQANAKLGAPTATATAPATSTKTATPTKTATTTTPTTKTAPATKAKPAATPDSSVASQAANAVKSGASGQVPTAELVQVVDDAITAHKPLAVLFVNPAAADDRAVASELAQVAISNPKVIGVVAPVSQLTQFAAITTKVPVVTSPTLVIINGNGRATTLTGYASTGEISQRIADAIAGK